MPGWTQEQVTIGQVMDNWKVFEDCCVFHGITYRTDFYRQMGSKLPEHVFYEDQQYNTIPFCWAKKIAVFDLFIYQYLVGNAQQSVAYGTQAKRIGHLEMVIWNMVDHYRSNGEQENEGKIYLLKKIRSVCMIYLATACIYEPDKRKGRELARAFCEKLEQELPHLFAGMKKKYMAYLVLNRLGVSAEQYQRMVRSGGYRKFKK